MFEATLSMPRINAMLGTVLFNASCVNACAQTKTICMVSILVQHTFVGAYAMESVVTIVSNR